MSLHSKLHKFYSLLHFSKLRSFSFTSLLMSFLSSTSLCFWLGGGVLGEATNKPRSEVREESTLKKVALDSGKLRFLKDGFRN